MKDRLLLPLFCKQIESTGGGCTQAIATYLHVPLARSLGFLASLRVNFSQIIKVLHRTDKSDGSIGSEISLPHQTRLVQSRDWQFDVGQHAKFVLREVEILNQHFAVE